LIDQATLIKIRLLFKKKLLYLIEKREKELLEKGLYIPRLLIIEMVAMILQRELLNTVVRPDLYTLHSEGELSYRRQIAITVIQEMAKETWMNP